MKRIYSKPVALVAKTIGATSILATSDPDGTITTPIDHNGYAHGPANARRYSGFGDFSNDNTSDFDLFISKESRGLWE